MRIQLWVSSNGSQQFLHSHSRQVGVEVALVVSASEHQQGSVDGARVHIRIFGLLCEVMEAGCLHGDDGVARPGDGELRERHLRPAVGVWSEKDKKRIFLAIQY